jgi:hypothetical protein
MLKNQSEETLWLTLLKLDFISEREEQRVEFAKFTILLVYLKVKLYMQLEREELKTTTSDL